MSTVINNPNAAFGQRSALDGNSAVVVEAVASGAIQKGQGVRGAVVNGRIEVSTATAATDAFVGVALESAATGRVVKVAVGGIVAIQASATSVAVGVPFSIGAGGRVATVSGTLNQKAAGWMLEASGTTAGALVLAYISPSLVAAS